jgi:hypothetical protein
MLHEGMYPFFEPRGGKVSGYLTDALRKLIG